MSAPRLGSAQRLTPASAGGRDAWSIAVGGLAVVSAVSIALLLFVALRPLPSGETDAPPTVVRVPSFETSGIGPEERQRLVDALTRENFFAHGRGEWARPTLLARRTDDEAQEEAPAPRAPVPAIATDDRVVNALGQVLAVVDKDELSNELQRAYEAVTLKGLFLSSAGEPTAMIARKHLEKAGRSSSYRAGDEFEFQKDSDATWRVEHVDMDLRRVALSRQGSTVWLRLRDPALAMGAPASTSGSNRTFIRGVSVPVIVPTTEAALRAEMLAAGLSAVEIDEYLALAASLEEGSPNEPKATGLAAGLMEAVKTIDGGKRAEGTPGEEGAASPSGIEALLKMMSTGAQPTREMLDEMRTPTPEPDEKKEGEKEDKKDEKGGG